MGDVNSIVDGKQVPWASIVLALALLGFWLSWPAWLFDLVGAPSGPAVISVAAFRSAAWATVATTTPFMALACFGAIVADYRARKDNKVLRELGLR